MTYAWKADGRHPLAISKLHSPYRVFSRAGLLSKSTKLFDKRGEAVIGAISGMVHFYSRATSRREATADSLHGLAGTVFCTLILYIAANRLSGGNSSVPGNLREPGKAGVRGSPQLTGGPRFTVAL